MKKIFASVILALMTMLAAGAVVFAEGNDSYALTIVKKIDKNGLPDDVLAWARDQEYTFRIDGFGYSGGEPVSLWSLLPKDDNGKLKLPEGVDIVEGNENALLVTIKGEASRTIYFDNAVAATVSEVTNGLKYDSGGDAWSMSTADCEASMPSRLVEGTNLGTGGSRDLTINIGKDGGKIMVSKPGTAKLVGYFRPRKKETNDVYRSRQSGLSGKAGESFPVKRVGPGQTVGWDNLKQGSYIVEKLEGAKGFLAYLGERAASVSQGGEGTININGNYGKLTITAPGTPGSNEQYYYVISGKVQVTDEDGNTHIEEYERVTNPVKAGERYVMDHLPKGLLTVREYNYSPFEEFSVIAPKLTTSTRTITHTKANCPKINVLYNYSVGVPEDVLYAKVKFDDIKGVTAGEKVQLGIKGTWNDSQGEEKAYRYSGTAGSINSINNRYLLPGSRILLGRYDDNITSIRVTFTYYREKIEETICKSSDKFYTQTVGTDWLEISKAEDKTPEGEIYYYYTILDKDDNPITNYSVIKNGVPVSGTDVTDREGTAVRMKSGDSVRLEGLQPGSYKIKETIDADQPEPFQMVVEETESTASSSGAVKVSILGSRTLTITKDKDLPGEELPDLLYLFRISGPGVEENVSLKAGESTQIVLPQQGSYEVTELDRNEIFELSYTDSGTVGIMTTTKAFRSRSVLGRSADEGGPDTSTVTFTNSFSREEGAYRVIHEYYFKDSDGTYRCEGSSTLSSVGGLSLDNTRYTDADVVTQSIFYGQPYRYFESAYGQAQIIDAGEQAQLRRATPSNIATPSNTDAGSDIATPSNTDAGSDIGAPSDIATGSNAAALSDIATGSDIAAPSGTAWVNVNVGSRVLREELSSRSAGSYESAEASEGTEASGEGFAGVATPSNQEEILSDEEEPDNDVELINDIEPDNDEPEFTYTIATPSGAAGIRSLQEEIMPLPSDEGIDIDDKDIVFDDHGIVSQGIVFSGGKRLAYGPEADKDYVEATREGNQVIILRYYRENKPITGNYKILHVYYLRNESGDIREGTSEIIDTEPVGLTEDTRKELHTAAEVEQLPHPFEYHDKNGDSAECVYEYIYDGCAYGKVVSGGEMSSDFYIFGDTYRPDDSMEGVYATEAGDQIIILRYYRKVNPINRTGSYKVVHEYYYQKRTDGGQFGEAEEDNSSDEETGSPKSRLRGDIPERQDAAERESGFGGTLVDDGDYSYTFEGMTEIENISAPLGHEAYAEKVEKKPGYTPADGVRHNYTFHNAGYGETMDRGYYEWMPSKQWAASTEEGNQIVILRYVRSEEKPTEPERPTEPEKPTDPTEPERPVKPTEPEKPSRPSGGGGGGHDPVPPRETVPQSPAETPAAQPPEAETAPSEPSDFAYPRELPDPRNPDSPERITIWEDGVPKTYYKVWDPETKTYVYLLEEEIPLSARRLPPAGDSRGTELWKILFFASMACGMIPLVIVRQREKRR